MLRLEMLPAAGGDCLLLEYGEGSPADGDVHRVLIDGGKKSAYADIRERLMRIAPDAQGRRIFELLVITHIDADHIEGIVALLQDPELGCWFNDIWFNGWHHLEPLPDPNDGVVDVVTLGPKDGEFLGAVLRRLSLPWNRHFAGRTVMIPDDGPLPTVTLTGGLALTLFSPNLKDLLRLRRKWHKVITQEGFAPGDDGAALEAFAKRMLLKDSLLTLGDEPDPLDNARDGSVANASSIGVIAEFDDHRMLLVGDATRPVMIEGLERFRSHRDDLDDAEPIPLDAFKLSHHGSKNNISVELIELMDCARYLISTSGAGFNHPDVEAIIAVMTGHGGGERGGKTPHLYFNYRTDKTALFDADERVRASFEGNAFIELP